MLSRYGKWATGLGGRPERCPAHRVSQRRMVYGMAGVERESGESYTRPYKYVFPYLDSSVADSTKYGTILGKYSLNCGIGHPYWYIMNLNLNGVERLIHGTGENMATIHAEYHVCKYWRQSFAQQMSLA